MGHWHARFLSLIRSDLVRPGASEDLVLHAVAEQAKLKPDPIGDHYQGGAFASLEFDGDTSRIIDWNKR